MWNLFLCLSLGVLLAFFVWAGFQRRIYNRNKILTPHVIGIMGLAAAGIIWFLPVFEHLGLGVGKFDVFVRSVLSTIQLFAAEGFKDLPSELFTSLPYHYTFFGGLIALSAPFFTFALILSCFKVFNAYSSYYRIWKDAYIFSELNDKSLSMAKSIKNGPGGKRCVIVFADIVDKNEEKHLDLVDGAKELNAVLFRKDVESIKWAVVSRLLIRRLNFYLISEDENEKIRQTKHIVEHYNSQKCSLYVFSDSEESKNLLMSYNRNKKSHPIHLNLMRIDAVRLLTYGYLADNGEKLFRKATESGGLKVINATIVGFGKYGSEMLRALIWFCQMPGYKIHIKVIDRDERTKARFEAMFPGIEVGDYSDDTSDIRYRVEFITAAFGERGFVDAVSELPENNYFFVSLGSDDMNMRASDAIRCAREQAGKTDDPHTGDDGDIVTTVIYSSDVKELVCSEVNVIGDLDSFYSYKTITGNRLLNSGYEEHLLWSYIYIIHVVGFGNNELRALVKLIDLAEKHGYKIAVSIYGSSNEAIETYGRKLSGYNVEYYPADPGKLLETAGSSNSLVISLGSKRQSDCAKALSEAQISVLRDYNPSAVESYFASRLGEREEITRNEYQLSEYNFNSSIAKALHRHLRRQIIDLYNGEICEVLMRTGSSKEAKAYLNEIKVHPDNSEESRAMERNLSLASEIEHIRWNAYMRSEGFVYNQNRRTRFMMHNKLVSVDKLTREERLKDI